MVEQQAPAWEQQTIEKLLSEATVEQRRRRRWGIFFKILWFIFLFFLVWLFWPTETTSSLAKSNTHASLVDIRGEIDENKSANADDVITGLEKAFKDKNTDGVILRINSPGGSPVQAKNIYDEILYQRKKHPKIKLYVVCSDACASAAYYIASAGDEIYASPSSLVGSIGVLLDSFGFVDAMKKVGVDRRLLTSGENKGFLDPFSPLKPEQQQRAQVMLDNVHQQFIQDVKKGRGNRLKENPQMFSGLVWTGSEALPLGIIDGFGNMQSVARDIIKNTTVVDYTVKTNLLDELTNRISSSFVGEIASELGIKKGGIR